MNFLLGGFNIVILGFSKSVSQSFYSYLLAAEAIGGALSFLSVKYLAQKQKNIEINSASLFLGGPIRG
jgi:thiamine transporter ThiT